MQLEARGEAMTRPAAVLAGPILTGVALNLALVVLAIVRYPAIFGAERVPFVLVDVAILLGYAAAAVAVARIADEGTVRALRSATWLGLVAGVLQGLEIVREDLVAAERVTALVTGLVSLLAMFALFGLAGVLAGAGPRGGALAGIWCAMTAMMALWLMAWGLDYAFADRLAQIWPTDYDYLHGNTLRDLSAYTLWNTLSAAFSHALLLPCFGAAFGLIGGAVGRRTPIRSG
ncbi:MAG: hypothetical protein M3O95_10425 [Candidatus Dormibacteraeota bacterium]|nr:hypothetical protein [Candidatus Dormibacteraeota bacterium]